MNKAASPPHYPDGIRAHTALQGQFQANQSWTDSSHPAPVRSTTMPKSAYNTSRNTPIRQNEFTFELSYYFLTGESIMSVANSWLPSLVASEKFFTPCSKCSDHHSSRESTLNFWDIERQEELCSICLHDYPRENVLQVGPRPHLLVSCVERGLVLAGVSLSGQRGDGMGDESLRGVRCWREELLLDRY